MLHKHAHMHTHTHTHTHMHARRCMHTHTDTHDNFCNYTDLVVRTGGKQLVVYQDRNKLKA